MQNVGGYQSFGGVYPIYIDNQNFMGVFIYSIGGQTLAQVQVVMNNVVQYYHTQYLWNAPLDGYYFPIYIHKYNYYKIGRAHV